MVKIHKKGSQIMSGGNKNRVQDNKRNKGNKNRANEEKFRYSLIPILAILCVLPFIVYLKIYDAKLSDFAWFPNNEKVMDLFLYYKQWFFVIITAIMTIILTLKLIKERYSFKVEILYIPLIVYAVFSLGSSILSKYANLSFFGSFDQFESILVVLGYCITVVFVTKFINDEKDIQVVMKYLVIQTLIMSMLGIAQFAGHDLFMTKFGHDLIVPDSIQNMQLQMNFEKNRVYLTLFNPNYVGVYTSFLLPIFLVLIFFSRNLWERIIYAISIIGLLTSMIGSRSLSGMIGLVISVLCICIFMWRYLWKKRFVAISVIVLLCIIIIGLNQYSGHMLSNKALSALHIQKSEYALTSMETLGDGIHLTYNGNEMTIQYGIAQDMTGSFVLIDKDGQFIASVYDSSTNSYACADERFIGLTFGVSNKGAGIFFIQEAGLQWEFTNQSGDGQYYYVNALGKLDKMVTADSVIFTGYESLASGRGYIWSRTIPLLGKYMIFGSGQDTFVTAFPRNDYLNYIRAGYGTQILTKPHNMYLQIGVQTGLVSLFAFLVFYGIYFITSVRLYIKGKFDNYYAQVGVAVFIGTISYMVTGFTNDSSITTAPIFWTLLGLGIVCNKLVGHSSGKSMV
jgi:hypothetical protein